MLGWFIPFMFLTESILFI